MKPKFTVLVLDANQRSSLAVVRSLGSKGITVISADSSRISLSGRSRFSSYYLQYPKPDIETDAFLAFLTDAVGRHKVDVLLPMTDLTVPIVLKNRNKFSHVNLPFPPIETIDTVTDKAALLSCASRLGIPTPKTLEFNCAAELKQAVIDLRYPVVVKPCKSKIWDTESNSWLSGKVCYADTLAELLELCDQTPVFLNHPFMLQEYIQGQGQGVFVACNKGHRVASFAHKRLREKPPSGGVSVLSESTLPDPKMLELSDRLLSEYDWHGVAMIEFKVTDDGTPYLMEINTRFWGSLQLAIDSGVDFPHILYKIATTGEKMVTPEIQTGRRLRWLLGDLDRLYICLKSPSLSYNDKAKECMSFLTSFNFSTRLDVLRKADIQPFIYEASNYLKSN